MVFVLTSILCQSIADFVSNGSPKREHNHAINGRKHLLVRKHMQNLLKKMESSGALAIVTSSVEKHTLLYEKYIDDGDTSSFKDVCEANLYTGYGIVSSKLECIGHIQKRLGTRLCEL